MFVSYPHLCHCGPRPQRSVLAINEPLLVLPFRCGEQDVHGSWVVERIRVHLLSVQTPNELLTTSG